jgi:hypothetical protein
MSDITDLLHTLINIDTQIAFNKAQVNILFSQDTNSIQRINELYADNYRLIQTKNKILQDDKLKHLSFEQLEDLKSKHSKKYY